MIKRANGNQMTKAYLVKNINAYRARVRQEMRDTLEQRMAEAKCRRLQGEELAARKAELEERDRLVMAKRTGFVLW